MKVNLEVRVYFFVGIQFAFHNRRSIKVEGGGGVGCYGGGGLEGKCEVGQECGCNGCGELGVVC